MPGGALAKSTLKVTSAVKSGGIHGAKVNEKSIAESPKSNSSTIKFSHSFSKVKYPAPL